MRLINSSPLLINTRKDEINIIVTLRFTFQINNLSSTNKQHFKIMELFLQFPEGNKQIPLNSRFAGIKSDHIADYM